MMNEYPGRRITHWICAGPKNYAFIHEAVEGGDEKLVTKIRGFQLNYVARVKLNFKRIVRMVVNRYLKR